MNPLMRTFAPSSFSTAGVISDRVNGSSFFIFSLTASKVISRMACGRTGWAAEGVVRVESDAAPFAAAVELVPVDETDGDGRGTTGWAAAGSVESWQPAIANS